MGFTRQHATKTEVKEPGQVSQYRILYLTLNFVQSVEKMLFDNNLVNENDVLFIE